MREQLPIFSDDYRWHGCPLVGAGSEHPQDPYLREGRMPHIWCPGCGIGSVLSSFLDAIKESEVPLDKLAVVSGIGCSGRAANYLNADSFHTTHGRAIPFATGLKLARPELNVAVISGDGDLAAIGGNHLIHAARRNIDLTVLCINNFVYGMTGGQVAPTTPLDAKTTTSPYGAVEEPFNLVDLMATCGAVYVARWVSLDVRRVKWSVREAFEKRGFAFIEVISPCPINYGRRNEVGLTSDDTAQMAELLVKRSEVQASPDPRTAAIGRSGPIICGKFVDIERPSYLQHLDALDAARGGAR